MTGLEVVALTAGTTVGAALGVRAWRRGPDDCAARVAAEGEPLAEGVERQQCDALMVRFDWLAEEGFVDRGSLDRARLLHDVATRADSPSERAAAQSELGEIIAATASSDTADGSRVTPGSKADGAAVNPPRGSSTCDIRAGS